jgi:hypothetical protein
MSDNLNEVWGPVRHLLQNHFTFNEIKDVAGLAGLDVTKLHHCVQLQGKTSTSKGQLMSALDGVLNGFTQDQKRRFFVNIIEVMTSRKVELSTELDDLLQRIGWHLVSGTPLPIELLEPWELQDLPTGSMHDLVRAVARYRDGDLTGAVSSACGAIDSVTAAIYLKNHLGKHGDASFQESVNVSLKHLGVLVKLESDLNALDWAPNDARMLAENLRSSLNQGAFVMQSLRGKMGDVHGAKPTLRPLVYASLKWSTLLLSMLKE